MNSEKTKQETAELQRENFVKLFLSETKKDGRPLVAALTILVDENGKPSIFSQPEVTPTEILGTLTKCVETMFVFGGKKFDA